MARGHVPGPIGLEVMPAAAAPRRGQCRAGDLPGPVGCEPDAVHSQRAPYLQRFTTDRHMLAVARWIPLNPPHDRAVFYAEDVGAQRAEQFVRENPGHTRLDELLMGSPEGRSLMVALKSAPW